MSTQIDLLNPAGIDLSGPPRPAAATPGAPSKRAEKRAEAPDRTILLSPDECSVSLVNGRDMASLNEVSCDGLIASVRAMGAFVVPVVVRRVDGRFEILCGARRWWSARWLRERGMPELMLPAVVREVDDEEAFRIGEHENAARVDLCAWEQGISYDAALGRFYQGTQRQLADALGKRPATISNLIALARWPNVLADAYPSRWEILEVDAERVVPAHKKAKVAVEAEAASIGAEQERRRQQGESPISRSEVTARLVRASSPAQPKAPLVIVDAQGQPIVTLRGRHGRGWLILVHPGSEASLGAACQQLLRETHAGTRGPVRLSGKALRS